MCSRASRSRVRLYQLEQYLRALVCLKKYRTFPSVLKFLDPVAHTDDATLEDAMTTARPILTPVKKPKTLVKNTRRNSDDGLRLRRLLEKRRSVIPPPPPLPAESIGGSTTSSSPPVSMIRSSTVPASEHRRMSRYSMDTDVLDRQRGLSRARGATRQESLLYDLPPLPSLPAMDDPDTDEDAAPDDSDSDSNMPPPDADVPPPPDDTEVPPPPLGDP